MCLLVFKLKICKNNLKRTPTALLGATHTITICTPILAVLSELCACFHKKRIPKIPCSDHLPYFTLTFSVATQIYFTRDSTVNHSCRFHPIASVGLMYFLFFILDVPKAPRSWRRAMHILPVVTPTTFPFNLFRQQIHFGAHCTVEIRLIFSSALVGTR